MPIWEKGSNMLLEVRNLSVSYGSFRAIENLSLELKQGEIVSIIGPNGAGKSTLLKAICGLLKEKNGFIDNGDILYEGESIKDLKTNDLVRKGISIVPEGRRIFPTMTVFENLEMGAYIINSGKLTLDRKRREDNKALVNSRMFDIFELFPILFSRKNQIAGTLSGGEQQMLSIGKALMLKPKLLFSDEPSLGLSTNYIDQIFDKLVEINKNGTSIFLVEQNAVMALEICHRGYVIELGSIVLEGAREKLINNVKVKRTYLGEN
jgi:branched-chain amino acid transport system ATP-binding protein